MTPIMTKKNQQTAKKQRGITIVEVSIGLIIAAILAAAAYLSFENNNRRNAVKSNVNTLTEMGAELKTKFGRTNRYGQVNTEVAIQSATIPPDLRDGANLTAANTYGGAIVVGPAQVQTPNDAVAVVWNSVPQDQCVDLAVGVDPAVREIAILAPGVTAIASPYTSAIKDQSVGSAVQELDIAELATECDTVGAANDGEVAMVFVFGRN